MHSLPVRPVDNTLRAGAWGLYPPAPPDGDGRGLVTRRVYGSRVHLPVIWKMYVSHFLKSHFIEMGYGHFFLITSQKVLGPVAPAHPTSIPPGVLLAAASPLAAGSVRHTAESSLLQIQAPPLRFGTLGTVAFPHVLCLGWQLGECHVTLGYPDVGAPQRPCSG